MSTEQVARLLTDFDRQEPPKGRSRVVPFDHALHSSTKAQPPKPAAPPPEDDAYQRGLSAGYATARTEYERKLNDEKEKFDVRLGEERSDLLNETAARIADNIEEVGRQLEARIAGVTARILEPLISNAVQKQAAASFVEKLSSITGDSRRPLLRITGPSEMIELVRSKLGARLIAVELRAEPVAEVSVIVDQTVLETQVKIWAERLKMAALA
jgi:vacuolar-type H+-ATPase subunit I/STV1